MDLAGFIKGAQMVGSALMSVSEVRQVFNSAVALLSTDDQVIAREALEDIMADNDEGHVRVQEKLERASRS